MPSIRMTKGFSESDSEEERHDRFRSERNNSSLNASKSLYSSGLQQPIQSRSPLRRLNSPSRRGRRSPLKRSRSRSRRSSHERKRIKEDKERREISKKESEKRGDRRSVSKNKEESGEDKSKETGRSESRLKNRSKNLPRSRSKEKKGKKESRRNSLNSNDKTSDTFLEKFERRRPSVENEVVDSTIIYNDSSPERESQKHKISRETKLYKKNKKRKTSQEDAEEGELISEEENNCFGPALPPRVESEEEEGELKDNVLVAEGPALPPGFNSRVTIGPVLPERLNSKDGINNVECPKSDSEGEIKVEKRIIGPALPPRENQPSNHDGDNHKELYGPALPPLPSTSNSVREQEEEEEEDVSLIGPLPRGMESDDRVQRILEERAHLLRMQLDHKESEGGTSEQKGRETWMLELPDVKTAAHLGLGPRKFKLREGADMSDRSSWTDIAGKKQAKEISTSSTKEDDSRKLEISARNQEMEIKAKQSTSHRDKSLLELHQKQIKKKKKKESSTRKEERRPFSREIDLQTNRFDEAQKKSIIKKAQLLNTRFSSGESKYL